MYSNLIGKFFRVIWHCSALRKMLLIMKMTFALIIFIVFGTYAKGLAQRITLSMKNAAPETVFAEIKKQSNYRFLYSDETIGKMQNMTIKVNDEIIENVMENLVKGRQISYKIIGGTVNIVTADGKENGEKKQISSLKKQDIPITGTVKDTSGQPLPGASIKVKDNPRLTATTNETGQFSLTVPENSTLIVSFIGYKTKEIPITNGNALQVVLEDGSELDEVVVIGYGTQTRKETTGSIASVKGDAIATLPVQSFDAALSGRATGVQMVANAGVVNQAPVFRIRGNNSISLSSYPLIVIDGVPTFSDEDEAGIGSASTNPMSAINPADIESIDIAKDAAATSIYGSRAANGVVFITTKKGKQGAAAVNYESWYGFTNANRLPPVLNAAQYVEIKNESLRNDNTYNEETNRYGFSYDANGNLIDTRWADYIYQTGFSQNHNLNISGATEKTNYYGSVGYTNQEGVFQKNGFNRKSANFNIDNKATSWLNVGGKINFINENNLSAMATGAGGSWSASGTMARLALISAPIVSPFNNDGSYNSTSNGFLGLQENAGRLNQSRLGFYNPVLSMADNYSNNKVNQVQSNAYIQLNPLPWLSLRSVYGIDYRFINYENYSAPLSGEAISTNGSASSANFNRERWVWTNTITANHVFADKHAVNFLLGQEQQKTDGARFGLQRTGQTDPFYSNIQGGWQNVFVYNTNDQIVNNYLFSLFSRVQYDFNKRYFITGNYRQDEYSALGINNKRGTFWGTSVGWEISQEAFWTNLGLQRAFSNFKIRGSYGKVGNVGGLGDFEAMNTYSAVLYGGQPGLSYTATGNPDLQWETSKKTDVGVGFGLLKNRLVGDVAYYKNSIDGLIFGIPLPPSVGIPNSTNNTILQNAGEMYNEGFEFSLSGLALEIGDFSWNSSFNLTTNKNRVVSLADGVPSIIASGGGGMTITTPGFSAGTLYAVRTDGVDPQTGRRIFIDGNGNRVLYQQSIIPGSGATYQWEYEDGSQAPAITPSDDAIPYRTAMATVFGGWDNSFIFKGFDLNILLTYQLGGYMLNGTQATMRDLRFWNNSTDILRRWQNPGDITDIPRVVNNDNVSNGNTFTIDENISSTDFLRLKNIMLGYSFPAAITNALHLKRLRIYASGQNLALWTKYTGFDPEAFSDGNNAILQGIDRNQAPNARTLTFGLNVGF